MKAKTFDCVEMKHQGAERVREQTKDMTPEQELAFWQERSHILLQRQVMTKRKHQPQEAEEKRRETPR
jgi:hypothetical protein